MIKRMAVFLLIGIIHISICVSGQSKRVVIPNVPFLKNDTSYTAVVHLKYKGQSTAASNYVAVDTMANSYGPASASLNPLVYDPYSNTLAVVHRANTTYGAGSGELWYNYSTDQGVHWKRTPAGINSSVALYARYPSMAISNYAYGTDINSTVAVFSWPQLTPTDFGYIGYGADQPIGAGAAFAAINKEPPAHRSDVPTWASDNTPWVFWTSKNSVNAALELWRTQDFITIEKIAPPQWSDSVFSGVGNIQLGGVSRNGINYIGVLGTFYPNITTDWITSGWYPAYSKSTDNGKTWSDFKIADFRRITALSKYDRLYDFIKGDNYVAYQGDINVDKNGYVHLLIQVTDTTTSSNSGINAVVEVFETSSGWDGKVVFEGITDSTFTKYDGPGLGQMGPSSYLAFSADGDVMAAQWVNGSPESNNNFCDIYFSYAKLGGNWSVPINLTNTPGMNENSSHFAPYLAKNGNEYTAFSFYNYEAGYTGYNINAGNPSVIYIAPVKFNVVTAINEAGFQPNSFDLSQNYPNPFNPATLIKYSIAERSNVILKVYDMLGREVASLINSVKDAGHYEINFDASKLSSGVYIYTLNAGEYSSSKKMLLLK